MEDKEECIIKEIEWYKEDPEQTVKNLQDFLNDKAHEGYFFDAVETASNPARFIVYMKLETDADRAKAKAEWKTTYGITGKGHADE